MIVPTATPAGGSATITLPPQLVADVQFVFVPTFHVFVPQITFWASATLPAPLGSTSQEVSFSGPPLTGGKTPNPLQCTTPPQPS
jgi:hypothetical protein